MSILINSLIVSDKIYFTIVSGATSSLYASFEWYLNNFLISRESTFSMNANVYFSSSSNPFVYVIVKDYSNDTAYWHDGQFYGGTFTGNFSDGTFHYGNLNGVPFFEQQPRPKPFKKI